VTLEELAAFVDIDSLDWIGQWQLIDDRNQLGRIHLLNDRQSAVLYDTFSARKCSLCEEYYVLNSDLFYDCPVCDRKAELDIESRFMIRLHEQG
jgi:hypothetical protein